MAKDHVREEGDPEGKLARNQQMLSADRYFNALKSKDEIDPNSRPLAKSYRAELEQQNADLRAEIARRKSGEKYAPKPAYPLGERFASTTERGPGALDAGAEDGREPKEAYGWHK